MFKHNTEWRCEFFCYAYSCFLPENQMVKYCEIQGPFLLTSQARTWKKVHKIRQYIQYQWNNYIKDGCLFSKALHNLFKRGEELNFTNNLIEIGNKIWNELVGKRSTVYKVAQAIAQLDATATVDWETLIHLFETDREGKYVKCFNKKKDKTIKRDRAILQLIRNYKNYSDNNPFEFNEAKKYLKNLINAMKPYLTEVEVNYMDAADDAKEQQEIDSIIPNGFEEKYNFTVCKESKVIEMMNEFIAGCNYRNL